jgi:hypothetical protein
MSKAITFFRNRRQETGQTYEFRIEEPPQTYRFFVFSRKPLEEKLVQTRNLSKEGGSSAKAEVEKIKAAIQRGPGGAIAMIYEENRDQYLWTIPVVSQPEVAFGAVGVLLPGDPALNLESLSDSKGILPFPPGAHALIPVDKEAEDSLRGFQNHLRYLSPDLEALVLHAIRDPSLDTRVSLLEAIVRKDMAESSTGKGWLLRLFPFLAKARWLRRPVSIWPLIAILFGLMLAANSFLLYSILLSMQQRSGNGAVTVPFIARHPEPPAPAASTTAGQKIFELIAAARKSPNPGLSALSKGHFSKVQKESDVKKILVPGENGALLARGLMKLEALRLDPTAAKDLLGSANNPTQVNNFYQGRDLEASSRELLAALACAGFGSPGLPSTQSAEAVPFADEGQDCKSFPLEKAVPGLDDLLKLVQETK